MMTVSCPICGSSQWRPEFTGADPISGDSFDVVACQQCDVAYVNPQPGPEKLPEYYPQDYYGERHPVFKDQIMAARARKLGTPSAGARVLDIGCGKGDFLLACRRKGWEVAGVEQAHAPVMALRDEYGIEIVTPEEVSSLPSDAFDFVTLWHVLEHLSDPRAVLGEAYRVLKPSGRILVEVPNFGGWQARIGREVWYHLDVPRHLVHFTRETLERSLATCGFQAQRWSTFSLEYDSFSLLQTFLNRICRQKNHLFQLLIRKPLSYSRVDTATSAILALPLGIVAGLISVVAPLAGEGGVLRVVAHKTTK